MAQTEARKTKKSLATLRVSAASDNLKPKKADRGEEQEEQEEEQEQEEQEEQEQPDDEDGNGSHDEMAVKGKGKAKEKRKEKEKEKEDPQPPSKSQKPANMWQLSREYPGVMISQRARIILQTSEKWTLAVGCLAKELFSEEELKKSSVSGTKKEGLDPVRLGAIIGIKIFSSCHPFKLSISPHSLTFLPARLLHQEIPRGGSQPKGHQEENEPALYSCELQTHEEGKIGGVHCSKARSQSSRKGSEGSREDQRRRWRHGNHI